MKAPFAERVVPSFQSSFEDASLRVIHHRDDGLDGKVSRLTTSRTPPAPTIDLYEGNNASQNLVCSLELGTQSRIDLGAHPECSNDEARSAVLHGVPAGRVLRLYDDPRGRPIDDWTEIVVKRDLASRVVPGFQITRDDHDLAMTYHRNNGLDGKVSAIEVSTTPSGPIIDLYEGNNATQNLVCSLEVGASVALDFTSVSQCDNDEARSAVLHRIPAGRALLLFDDPRGGRHDDWTAILTRGFVGRAVVGSFERTTSGGLFDVVHLHDDGLDGKVSHLATTAAGDLTGILSLHEGNGGTQNKVCDLDLASRTLNFKNHRACDNDEARSATLLLAEAGTVVRLYDDPDCERGDDWIEITVLRNLGARTVGSFERSFADADLRVRYHRDNGLDGKVSCARISVP